LQNPEKEKTVKTTDFIKLTKTPRAFIALVCLLAFHSATAKSSPPSAPPPEKAQELILSLPADQSIENGKTGLLANTWQTQNTPETLPLIVGGRKKAPLNVDCGMDLYKNTGPDISLTSRLTGNCDLKYHY
jgi:hypothetical protein